MKKAPTRPSSSPVIGSRKRADMTKRRPRNMAKTRMMVKPIVRLRAPSPANSPSLSLETLIRPSLILSQNNRGRNLVGHRLGDKMQELRRASCHETGRPCEEEQDPVLGIAVSSVLAGPDAGNKHLRGRA